MSRDSSFITPAEFDALRTKNGRSNPNGPKNARSGQRRRAAPCEKNSGAEIKHGNSITLEEKVDDHAAASDEQSGGERSYDDDEGWSEGELEELSSSEEEDDKDAGGLKGKVGTKGIQASGKSPGQDVMGDNKWTYAELDTLWLRYDNNNSGQIR
jgi:hypothetical protein